MSVWNTFDTDLVNDIFKKKWGSNSKTIGEQVRLKSVAARTEERRQVQTQRSKKRRNISLYNSPYSKPLPVRFKKNTLTDPSSWNPTPAGERRTQSQPEILNSHTQSPCNQNTFESTMPEDLASGTVEDYNTTHQTLRHEAFHGEQIPNGKEKLVD